MADGEFSRQAWRHGLGLFLAMTSLPAPAAACVLMRAAGGAVPRRRCRFGLGSPGSALEHSTLAVALAARIWVARRSKKQRSWL